MIIGFIVLLLCLFAVNVDDLMPLWLFAVNLLAYYFIRSSGLNSYYLCYELMPLWLFVCMKTHGIMLAVIRYSEYHVSCVCKKIARYSV